jgi:hypothetical protein
MSEYCESCGVFLWPDKPHSCEVAEITRLRSELSAAKEAEAAAVEKVRRLVVAQSRLDHEIKYLRQMAKHEPSDGVNILRIPRDCISKIEACFEVALSEVEALIGTPQQSKGG